MIINPPFFLFFFFNDTATTEIYTLSLHDALPICTNLGRISDRVGTRPRSRALPVRTCSKVRSGRHEKLGVRFRDRKSTRLNSSHDQISYAVFCLKKKKKTRKKSNNSTT